MVGYFLWVVKIRMAFTAYARARMITLASLSPAGMFRSAVMLLQMVLFELMIKHALDKERDFLNNSGVLKAVLSNSLESKAPTRTSDYPAMRLISGLFQASTGYTL